MKNFIISFLAALLLHLSLFGVFYFSSIEKNQAPRAAIEFKILISSQVKNVKSRINGSENKKKNNDNSAKEMPSKAVENSGSEGGVVPVSNP